MDEKKILNYVREVKKLNDKDNVILIKRRRRINYAFMWSVFIFLFIQGFNYYSDMLIKYHSKFISLITAEFYTLFLFLGLMISFIVLMGVLYLFEYSKNKQDVLKERVIINKIKENLNGGH